MTELQPSFPGILAKKSPVAVRSATELAQHISRRYHTAKALSFSSPLGNWWVSVRVRNDDRQRAEELARETQTSEGSIFIVRLD